MIVFGIVLFFYLVVFAGIATLLGHPTGASTNVQLILGNYTNVSSWVGRESQRGQPDRGQAPASHAYVGQGRPRRRLGSSRIGPGNMQAAAPA